MTLLVSWAGVDTHGVASAYIAADSRITWGERDAFDHGRKVYAFRSSPDILGYCGDVLFPTIVLSQVAEMADCGLLFSQTATCEERFEAIRQKLAQQFQAYPRMVASITASTLQVLHVARDFESTDFAAWMIEWRRSSGWTARAVEFPTQSSVLFALGTGSAEFTENMARYVTEGEGGTSRSVFHCFCDTLFNTHDQSCGGAPQLVGIIRKPRSAAIAYGTIVDGQRFFLGAQVEEDASLETIEWRNDLFELCDGRTMEKHGAAQSQPDRLRRT